MRVAAASPIVRAVERPRRPEDELKVAGVAAVRAALAMRPESVRRFFLVEARVRDFGDVLGELARSRLVRVSDVEVECPLQYHIVTAKREKRPEVLEVIARLHAAVRAGART